MSTSFDTPKKWFGGCRRVTATNGVLESARTRRSRPTTRQFDESYSRRMTTAAACAMHFAAQRPATGSWRNVVIEAKDVIRVVLVLQCDQFPVVPGKYAARMRCGRRLRRQGCRRPAAGRVGFCLQQRVDRVLSLLQ